MTKRNVQAVIAWSDQLAEVLASALSKRVPEGEVVVAADSDTVMRYVQRYRPKLVVIYSQLTPQPGDELAAMLKQDTENSDLSVLTILPKGTDEERRKFILLGCNGVFSLPLDLQDFFSISARILGLNYRRAVRFPVEITLEVMESNRKMSALSANISKSGMLLGLQEDMRHVKRLTVAIEPDDGEGSLIIPSTVVRASRRLGEHWYGIQFDPLGPELTYRLERFIMKRARSLGS